MSVDPSDYMPPALEEMAGRIDNVRPLRATTGDERGRPMFAIEMFGEMDDDEDAPDWLIDEYGESNTLAMVFGDPGCCKSFMAVDLTGCVSTGTRWHGRDVKRGPVLYIAGEGRRGLKRRFKAWARRHSVSWKSMPVGLSTMATALTDPVAAAEFLAVLAGFILKHGKPALIVIDTLARNFGGGDENVTQDMGIFVQNCDAIREASGGAMVLLIHHSGHGDKARSRGASSLGGALDHAYRMTRDETGLVKIECKKMKDGSEPPDRFFNLEDVELGYNDSKGRPVKSAVLQCTDAPIAPAQAGKSGKGKHQKAALDAFHTLHSLAVDRLAKQGYDPDGARVSFDDWRTACIAAGIPKNRFYELRDTLVSSGFLRMGQGVVILNEVPNESEN